IVDENNLLKKQTSSSKTWVMFYSVFKKGIKIAYSTDNGKSWNNSENTPSIPNLDPESRDPKVFWYEPTKTWVMLIYRKPGSDEFEKGFSIYNSKDLIHWEYKSHITGFYESPDLFQLPLNNRKNDLHWVLTGGNGNYQIGTFNGETFTPETAELKFEYGKNFYSPLTWRTSDDKIIQIASLRGAIYPDMPFTGQMSFPCELSLQKFTEGMRLCRKPVNDIELLHDNVYEWKEKNIYPGLNKNILSGLEGDCFHILVSFNIKSSDTFGLLLRKGKEGMGTEIIYSVSNKVLSCMNQNVYMEPNDGNINLDIIVDRSSIEIFSADGKISITNNFNPEPKEKKMMLFTIGGEVMVNSLKVYRMNSMYDPLKKIKKK
ncbi:MAG: glycoside hydrolase family 32 protein, partial [Bacteroidota bacterium]|nr:glycoside hydrolase family 32 protein [Bacteroidota bacterium]